MKNNIFIFKKNKEKFSKSKKKKKIRCNQIFLKTCNFSIHCSFFDCYFIFVIFRYAMLQNFKRVLEMKIPHGVKVNPLCYVLDDFPQTEDIKSEFSGPNYILKEQLYFSYMLLKQKFDNGVTMQNILNRDTPDSYYLQARYQMEVNNDLSQCVILLAKAMVHQHHEALFYIIYLGLTEKLKITTETLVQYLEQAASLGNLDAQLVLCVLNKQPETQVDKIVEIANAGHTFARQIIRKHYPSKLLCAKTIIRSDLFVSYDLLKIFKN